VVPSPTPTPLERISAGLFLGFILLVWGVIAAPFALIANIAQLWGRHRRVAP